MPWRRRSPRDFSQELEAHLALEADRLREEGVPPAEARAQARRNLGNVTQIEERFYEAGSAAWVESFFQDLRFAARQLWKNPAFALAAALTLALGIGANTAIVTVVRRVLLTPLPFTDPGRLVEICGLGLKSGEQRPWVSFRDAEDWRERTRSFTEIGSFGFAILNLTCTDRPEALYGATVSADLFQTLGVRPELGRTFLPEEDRPGRDRVVILSHKLWTDRFAGDSRIAGKHIRLVNVGGADDDYTVVGVMPAGFNFPLNIPSAVSLPTRQMAYWIPFGLDPGRVARDGRSCMTVARLAPGRTPADAQHEMDSVAAQLAREYPATNTDRGVRVLPLEDYVLGRTRTALLLLLGATGLVLLIACVNAANLLLARAMSRGTETAVRVALGASRARIIRQWLTESVLLGLGGGVLGYAVAFWGTVLLLKLAPDDTPRLSGLHLDTAAFLFNLAVSVLVGLLFGVLPAWKTADLSLAEAIQAGGVRSTDGPGRSRTRSLLIVVEVALSMILVTGAGLMVRSIATLLTQDHGFHADRVMTAIMVLPQWRYPDQRAKVAFYRKVLDRVTQLPGVESAGAVSGVPLSGNISGRELEIEGRSTYGRGEGSPVAEVFPVSENYLPTMGIKLVSGRNLSRHDSEAGFRAVIVNEAAAHRFWPDADALGGHLRVVKADKAGDWRVVVGIVKDTSDQALDETAKPAVYMPMEQGVEPPQFLAVRTADSSGGFAAALRRTVASLDRDQPLLTITTMDQLVESSIGPRLFAMRVLAAFGVLSLILAGIGLYGVISYSVARRSREIGVRLALGATRAGIFQLVLRQSMRLTAAGLVIGAVCCFASMRWISSLLYGVTAHDPVAAGASCGAICMVAIFATYFPARQAMRVDPASSLRNG
jgi:predicted permease